MRIIIIISSIICSNLGAKIPGECGIRSAASRIVGGQDAQSSSHPWAVAFVSWWSHTDIFCGGVLINSQWILTAAHCFKDKQLPNHVKVIVGGDDRFNYSRPLDVDTIVAHKDYKQGYNDIALVRLKSPVSQQFVPICLPTKLWPKLSEGTVSGWGLLSGNGSVPNQLQEATFSHFPREECQKFFEKGKIREEHVCIQSSVSNVCRGDSGGPLVSHVNGKGYVMGVASFNTKGCAPEMPAVFTKTSHFLNWIECHVNEGVNCTLLK